VWNWANGCWTFRDLPNVTHGDYGQVAGLNSEDIIDADTGIIDADTSAIDEVTIAPNDSRLVLCSAAAIGVVESSMQDLGADLTAYLERRGIPLSDGVGLGLVTSVRPRIRGAPGLTVNVTVGTSMAPSDDYEMQDAVPFVIGTDDKVDVFATGRFCSVRFESTAHEWAMRTFDIEAEPAGLY
jgi:hypothetical protein